MALPAALAARPLSRTARKIVDSEHYSTTSDGGWTRTIWTAEGEIVGTLHKQSRRIGRAPGWVTSLSRRDSRFFGTLAEGASVLVEQCRAAKVEAEEGAAALAEVEPVAPAPATVTMTREALVDMLTTAASIGRNSIDCTTRGDLTDRLGTYGYAASSDRLDQAIEASEQYATAMRAAR